MFGDDGWPTREEMRWSGHDESLGVFLSGLTGLSPDEAHRVAEDFMNIRECGGGRQEGARMALRLGLGVVGALVGAGILGILGTVVVRSIFTSPRGWAHG